MRLDSEPSPYLCCGDRWQREQNDIDMLDEKFSSLIEWLGRSRLPTIPLPDAVALYHSIHPRSVFLRFLPRGAKVIDFGAGNGSLANYLTWPGPHRLDVHLYAYSLEYAENFTKYTAYEIGNFETDPPNFHGMRFDALFASHVIEHLSSLEDFVTWLDRSLKPEARLYLEWPSPKTMDLPPAALFRERGFDLMISNFFDDCTHKQIPTRDSLRILLQPHGFMVEAEGLIRFPWLEDELLARSRETDSDSIVLLNAYWSKTLWAQYMVFSRGS